MGSGAAPETGVRGRRAKPPPDMQTVAAPAFLKRLMTSVALSWFCVLDEAPQFQLK